MIIFKKIKFKNFGSFGNNMTEIVLDKNNSTLICGNNGSGKSFAFLDSITFALFGKPFRKINIPQLVNTVNEKGCLVEIEFERGSDTYIVRRGLGPRLFEIYKNGDLLNQDAKSLDYQELLEQQILKMNYKTFTQVVILGSSAFVPFMQLSASDRRNVIENILDINIFSTMNVVLKGKILSLKETLKNYASKIEIEKAKISSQENLINTLEKKNKEDNQEKLDRIEELKTNILEKESWIISNNLYDPEKGINTNLEITKKNKNKILSITKAIAEVEAEQKKFEKEIKFFQENKTCPTCSQNIDDSVKKSKILSNNLEISDIHNKVDLGNKSIKDIEMQNQSLENALKELQKTLDHVKQLNRDIEAFKTEIKRIESSLKKTSFTDEIHTQSEHLKTYKSNLSLLDEEKQQFSDDLMYHELASDLLKDGGVKAKIIKYYLPHMNKFINKFLTSMDFFVQFHLDEEFNEHIKSRHRDEFSYMNFSEGEKMRIDLALLLSWREVAKMKNSVHCNLLILDEVFDSSLDSVGMDELMKLLKSVSQNCNVYVISHKSDQLMDKFTNVITFEKKNNFSKMINN
jgi:DNA repair exonuclease SbcCD ATPase subunit